MKRRRPERIELGIAELTKILDRAASSPLAAEDLGKLRAVVDTLAFLTQELEAKGASVERLRRLLFGATTETTRTVLGEDGGRRTGRERRKSGTPRKGHGRNGAAAYRGAERVRVAHASLRHGDACPDCTQGKVYGQADPAVLVRVKGMAPLRATVYEMDRLRCHLCGTVFTAEPPAGLGTEKYDETAASMIALLKYGAGLPFHRLEQLERDLGIPLPAATQWEVVQRAAGLIAPAYRELNRQAAQGEVVHNDDTPMKILDFTAEARAEAAPGADAAKRTGVFTSGIVSVVGGNRRIALFMTGPKHAGENLAAVLTDRTADRSPPIQMCDALSHNTAGEFEAIVAHCIAHARRRYVEVATSFPEECRYVLETLREVYRTDARARTTGLSPAERLRLHQEESGPRMETLEKWLRDQIDQHQVEPNSGLGAAIGYMRKHWDQLTLFLRVPGAPLDNNLCERALKKAILHRKNALFYKTENGARVGDVFMSLIHTAELCQANPFDYLVALQRHAAAACIAGRRRTHRRRRSRSGAGQFSRAEVGPFWIAPKRCLMRHFLRGTDAIPRLPRRVTAPTSRGLLVAAARLADPRTPDRARTLPRAVHPTPITAPADRHHRPTLRTRQLPVDEDDRRLPPTTGGRRRGTLSAILNRPRLRRGCRQGELGEERPNSLPRAPAVVSPALLPKPPCSRKWTARTQRRTDALSAEMTRIQTAVNTRRCSPMQTERGAGSYTLPCV